MKEEWQNDVNNMKNKLLPSNEKTMICNMNSNNNVFSSDEVLCVYIYYNYYNVMLRWCCLKYHDHLY